MNLHAVVHIHIVNDRYAGGSHHRNGGSVLSGMVALTHRNRCSFWSVILNWLRQDQSLYFTHRSCSFINAVNLLRSGIGINKNNNVADHIEIIIAVAIFH